MEEEIKLKRKKLQEMLENKDDETVNFTTHEINWIHDEEVNNWLENKNYNKSHLNLSTRLFLTAHSKDKCKGKPQLIHQTIQRIPLLRKIEIVIKGKTIEDTKWGLDYKFIDDRFDKRYDGRELSVLAFDFWIYRIIDNGKEIYLLSKDRLVEEYSEISGMKIDLNDLSGISDTLKLNKIATIMLVKEHKPAVRVIDPNELVKFTEQLATENGWDRKGFEEYIFTHPDGNVYDYTKEFNILRMAQFLSGKYEGYPLHMLKIGPVGTGKTTEAEAIDYKFREELGILEAGTSRMKVLVPSFKEKPANLGYVCNCNRVAIVDELMKMVANAMQNQHVDANNYFGELNMLLEQKKRLVGSGNDNSTIVRATAKVCITTNPLKGKAKLSHHLSQLDNTTLSRMLIWVQSKSEAEKIYNKNDVKPSKFRFPQETKADFTQETSISTPENTELSPRKILPRGIFSDSVLGAKDSVHGNYDEMKLYHDFLTIYDSCQTFLVDFDIKRIKEVFTESVNESSEAMKQVWRSRGLHHSVLVLDGITKLRCLFKDYDSRFKAKEEDYELLQDILIKMVRGWETDLEGNFRGF